MSKINFAHKEWDFDKLNSLTKYPSILTYHELGTKGGLKEGLVEGKSFAGQEVYITEKVDGTNGRIVFVTNDKGEVIDYLLGSRENLLYAKGDRVENPSLNIVSTMKYYADILCVVPEQELLPNHIYALYGEVYGGNCNGFKNYTSRGTWGVRFFDVWAMPLNEAYRIVEEKEIAAISIWREHNGQPFFSVGEFAFLLATASFGNTPYEIITPNNYIFQKVPYIKAISGSEIPEDLKGAYEFLKEFALSGAVLEPEAAAKSEGVVIRTADRKLIRKLRFDDYRKTEKQGLIK